MTAVSDSDIAAESALVTLRIDVPPPVRREIKVRAAQEGISMQDLVRGLIYRGLGFDRSDSSR